MTDQLEATTFEPHRGTEFTTIAADASVVLRLATVDAYPEQPGAPRVRPFTLVFAGPLSPALEQGIHRLEHPALGTLDIFLVPIASDVPGSRAYEAVFN
jgi:uncharacterized protein DUF6916